MKQANLKLRINLHLRRIWRFKDHFCLKDRLVKRHPGISCGYGMPPKQKTFIELASEAGFRITADSSDDRRAGA